ncbi:MAG: BrnA antitoxin family protein [Geobacter sp.]|nr:BrnA antitoxin family protein [Geobacter sp.]
MKKEYDFSMGKRGAVVQPEPGKSRITIRLDNEVLDWFRAKADEQGGGNYQTMINQVLKEYIHQDKSLADILRQVIREELKPAA